MGPEWSTACLEDKALFLSHMIPPLSLVLRDEWHPTFLFVCFKWAPVSITAIQSMIGAINPATLTKTCTVKRLVPPSGLTPGDSYVGNVGEEWIYHTFLSA